MKKWEYKTLCDDGFSTHYEWVEALNQYGEEGWELINLLESGKNVTAYLKREITNLLSKTAIEIVRAERKLAKENGFEKWSPLDSMGYARDGAAINLADEIENSFVKLFSSQPDFDETWFRQSCNKE